jgi:hypothetical protein
MPAAFRHVSGRVLNVVAGGREPPSRAPVQAAPFTSEHCPPC